MVYKLLYRSNTTWEEKLKDLVLENLHTDMVLSQAINELGGSRVEKK